MSVLLVCSSDTHVRMLAPVAAQLRQLGIESRVLSLDPYYGQGAGPAAEELGLPVAEPEPIARSGAGEGFYARPVHRVWRDVLVARGGLRRALRRLRPRVIVVGNDFGLIEKLVMHAFRSDGGGATVLVQDGRLSAVDPRPVGLRGRALAGAKGVISPLLRAVGLPFLAASRYGEGGASAICATGEVSAALLTRRARGRARVVVTGQPRYDRLFGLVRRERQGPIQTASIFTTPFAEHGLGDELQRAQLELVGALHRLLDARGARLVVKPHPRERPGRYEPIVGETNVSSGDPAQLLAAADLAVIGISTLVEEAGLLSCPAIVPGRMVHRERFDARLPDRAAYPRVDSAADLERWLDRLDDAEERRRLAGGQRRIVTREISFDPARPAAVQVARVIADLG